MAKLEFQDYIVKVPRTEVAAMKERISASLATEITERALILLTVLGMTNDQPVVKTVEFLPKRVEAAEDGFMSWGTIGETAIEASIKAEDDNMYLVMDTALEDLPNGSDDQHLPTAV